MIKVALVDWTRPSTVAFIVKVRVPLGTCFPTDTYSVEEPEFVIALGLKLYVVFGGKPLTLRSADPGLAVTVTV
jgi:hypothetical protein